MDNKFSSSINDIDERIFEKYYAFERKLDIKRAQKAKMKAKLFAAAACFTIFACIGVTVILPAMRKDNPDDPLSIPSDTYTETEHSFLTDTVHQNGEKVEDDTNESAMETAEETVDEVVTEPEVVTDADTAENAVTGEAATEEETISGCNHIWKLESEKDSKYKCSKCNAIHFCTNPEDLEKVGNLNESTLIYRCRICGTQHYTTDPDSIKPDDEIDSPLGSMLKFEIIDEKLICQTVPSASRIVYSHVSDMSKETVYDNRYDIINVIFQAMDGKTAILDTYECEFLHYIYLFDSENDSWSYKIMLCDCGAVTIIGNDDFLCSIEISNEELQMILDSLNFF